MFELEEPRAPAFIGLWEAIAWVGLRDEIVSSRVRSDVAEWLARGHQQKILPLDIFDGLEMPIGDAFECLADLCRTNELGAKGKAHDGFRDITSNEWHELSLIGARSPDALSGAPFLAGMGEDDTGWTSVRFKRSDIERLFPAKSFSSCDPTDRTAAVSCDDGPPELTTESVTRRKTNKEPGWLPLLRREMEVKDTRHARLRLLDQPEPNWPKAPWFKKRLIEEHNIAVEKLPDSTVRTWVAKLNKDFGR